MLLKKMIIFIGMMFLLSACGDSSNIESGLVVTITSHNSTMQYPRTEIIAVNSSHIKYKKTQSDKVLKRKRKKIDQSDFEAIREIVTTYKLFEMDDVAIGDRDLLIGGPSWIVTLEENGKTHTIKTPAIPPYQFPEGLRKLYDAVYDLIDIN